MAAALLAGCAIAAFQGDAAARTGSDPLACMTIALDYAQDLAERDDLPDTLEGHRATLARYAALADDEATPPRVRMDEARTFARSREARDLDREVRGALRLLDNARSVVAGWRGNYCPVARPDGGAGLSGQARCDAASATFVDELRIERRSPAEAQERERLSAERQTILKARVTRDDRNDLLELWRLRSEAYDTLIQLERLEGLQARAGALVEELRATGCADADNS